MPRLDVKNLRSRSSAPISLIHTGKPLSGERHPGRLLNANPVVSRVLELQRTAGNLAVTRLLEQGKSTQAPPRKQGRILPLQRDVGYEFETGWLVEDEDKATDDKKGWLKKKEPIGGANTGFKLEADEAGGGRSEIEFIVHPPIIEGPAGERALESVMDTLTALGRQMERVTDDPRYMTEGFSLAAATNRTIDEPFHVYPERQQHPNELYAGPQVTTGLDLSKIGSLGQPSSEPSALSFLGSLAGLQSPPGPPAVAPTELSGTISRLSNVARSIKGTGSLKNPSPSLKGLTSLLVAYLEGGNAPGTQLRPGARILDERAWYLALDYPKQLADQLLARTDFNQLFNLLPKSERTALSKNPTELMNLVLANTPRNWRPKPEDSVIGIGVKVDEDDKSKGIYVPELTIAEWLIGIPQGEDRLRTLKNPESLGELGKKTEKVGQKGGRSKAVDVGIFEFRGAQIRKIPLERWKPFALEFHRYISAVHGGEY